MNTNLTWAQINEWFDKFYSEFIDGDKTIRGRSFTGAKIEIYGKDSISIVVNHPRSRGIDTEQKAIDFVRSIENEDAQEAYTDFNYERFASIVIGSDSIKDADWIWEDET